jgi:cellulose synthase/poly-beta-1,6-N-acetylglucosamine synthase-like glycosyltransferase
MYLGPAFPPLSLLGLLFKGGAVATAVPHSQVSVVIPVYNGEKTIESCVRHVQDQSLKPFEVIVMDDCSADMTPVKLGELSRRHPNMVVLRNSENLGKAASVNAALTHVGSPITAIVDSDTYLDGDYLRNTLSVLNGDGTVGASGMVLPSDVDGGVSRSRFVEYLHGQSTYKGIQSRLGATFVSPGCCSVWRTDWIKRNGVPEETVVEDMDLTWEAQIDGGRIAFNPKALAFTEEPGSLGAYVGQLRRWFSWRPVLEKHRDELSNGLKVLVSWMLAESVGYLFWLGVMLYLLFSGRFVLAFIMFLGDLVLVSLISLYQCRRIGFPLSKVLVSIPYYYALRIPTALVFWGSFLFPKRKGW